MSYLPLCYHTNTHSVLFIMLLSLKSSSSHQHPQTNTIYSSKLSSDIIPSLLPTLPSYLRISLPPSLPPSIAFFFPQTFWHILHSIYYVGNGRFQKNQTQPPPSVSLWSTKDFSSVSGRVTHSNVLLSGWHFEMVKRARRLKSHRDPGTCCSSTIYQPTSAKHSAP